MPKKGYEDRVAIVVRVPISLHKKILFEAKLARLTPSQYCERKLSDQLSDLLVEMPEAKKGDR